MTIGIDHLRRGFLSEVGITARIKDASATFTEKLRRAFYYVVSLGESEELYKLEEDAVASEFCSGIGRPLSEAEIQVDNNGRRFIEKPTSLGTIKVEETGDWDSPLKGTLNYWDKKEKEWVTEDFQIAKQVKNLTSFQAILQKDLALNIEEIELKNKEYKEYANLGGRPLYDISGEFPEPQLIRNDLIIRNGTGPSAFPGQFYDVGVTKFSLSDLPVIEELIAKAESEEKSESPQIEVESQFGKIRVVQKQTKKTGENGEEIIGSCLISTVIKNPAKETGVRNTAQPELDLSEIREFSTIEALKQHLNQKIADRSSVQPPSKVEPPQGRTPVADFISVAEKITVIAKNIVEASITETENGKQIETDSLLFGKIKIVEIENDEGVGLNGVMGEGEFNVEKFSLFRLQGHLVKHLLKSEGIKALEDVAPISKAIVEATISDGQVEIDSIFGKIKLVEAEIDGANCLKVAFDDREFLIREFSSIESLQIYFGNKLIEKGIVESFFTKSAVADVRALHGPNEQVKYELPDGHGGLSYIEFPPEIDANEENSPRIGGCKKITHKDNDYVGFTLYKKNNSSTFDASILKVIVDESLDHVVPQYRVSAERYISRNLGVKDLWGRILASSKNRYQFYPSHFKALASDIAKLHKRGIIHRDIRSENAFLCGTDVYITDLDTMVRVSDSTQPIPRLGGFAERDQKQIEEKPIQAFKTGIYNADNKPIDSPVNGFKKDQLDLFLMMMEGKYLRSSDNGFTQIEVEEFVNHMPCEIALKIELGKFLTNPVKNKLSLDLDAYFN